MLAINPSRRNLSLPLAEACDWMKGHLGKNPNARNELNYITYWKSSKFAHWSLAALRDWDLITWRKEVLDEDNAKDQGVGPAALVGAQTCIHRMNALSKVVQTWGRAHRITLDNPIKPGVRPRPPKGRERRLYPEEEELLLKAAEKSSRSWLRAAIVIAVETGIRQAELVDLTWTRVNLDRQFLDLTRTKNGRLRRVPLSNRAIEAFRSLPSFRDTVLPIETTNGIMQAFRDINTFPDLRWHDLRHEAISRLFEYTDLRDHEVMAISGHLSPAMLSRYTHLRTDRLADRLRGGRLNARAE
ncbi:site-specific integrase [Rhodopila sp.]|uniref:site-specific integrase n=1 Tax=Rhodopila sp. TaxID=2480087 RepID=UPI003D0B164A